MEKEQELEWAEAQKIIISENLVAAAKQKLQFLAAVDRNRRLYDGPALDRAIYRYKYCWLPLLAKHAESQVSEGPLVAPLDCEWIWHCHRLNPVRYKADCEEFYGLILDNSKVVSSVQGISRKQTEEIWNRMYPNEPYELGMSSHFLEDVDENNLGAPESTKYDLVSAVKRQSPFFYQVSRPSMNDDLFLEAAVARYKGFLHLIKRNREKSIKHFCVPTYDIDLIWHSHQLHPVSYCKDLVALLGRVLDHNDTDSDRTKGKKLDLGFSGTTKQWENTFGSRYWRAGTMNRGNAPSPLTTNLSPLNTVVNKGVPSIENQTMIQLPKTILVEVMVEIVDVKNSPAGHQGSLFVSISKTQPDVFFNTRRSLSILSKSEENHVAAFQCVPTGELLFELMSSSPSHLPLIRPAKVLGTTLISLENLQNQVSKFSMEKWFELVPSSGIVSSKPISLRIAFSFTPPVLAPYMLHMVRTRPFTSSSCFFPLPERVQRAKSWISVVDEVGNDVISIQMRDSNKGEARKNTIPKKEVIGMITGTCKTHVLADFIGTGWSLMDSHWFLQLQNTFGEDGHIFELTGRQKTLVIFPGRKLEYETKNSERQKNERDFMTIVEFSAEDPYGKAVALLNLKSGFIKVKEEWLVLLGITLAFILSDILKKDGCIGFSNDTVNLTKDVNWCTKGNEKTNQVTVLERELDVEAHKCMIESVACGCDHGYGYENIVKSSGCGPCGGCSGCGGCRGGGGCRSGGCSAGDNCENGAGCGSIS